MQRKFYPRVEKQFSAVVENGQGLYLNVVAVDASTKDVCIECKTYERNLITPGGRFVSEFNGKPIELYVWLDLPFAEGKAERVRARCHVLFSRRVSNQQCKIGMRYKNFDKNDYDTLVKFIEFAKTSNKSGYRLN